MKPTLRIVATVVAVFAFCLPAHAKPGDSISAPIPLNIDSGSGGVTLSDLLLPGGATYYSFGVSNAGSLFVGVFGLGSGSSLSLPDGRVDLLDSAGNVVAPFPASSLGTSGQSSTYAFVGVGNYYPRVTSASNGQGKYALDVFGAPDGRPGSYTASLGPAVATVPAVPEASPLPLLALGICTMTCLRRSKRWS